MVYYSLFYPRCILAWVSAASCNLKLIFCMQKKVRYVCHVPALTSTNSWFKKNFLKFNEVFILPVCNWC